MFRGLDELFPLPATTSSASAEMRYPPIDDLAIVKRVLSAYQLAASDREDRGDSLWQGIFDARHRDIHRIFKDGRLDAAARVLRDPACTDLFYGIDDLAKSLLPNLDGPSSAYHYAASCLDGLVRLAEAIAAIRLENPEGEPPQGPWTANPIVDEIETVLGQELSIPNIYPKELGVLTKRGIVSYRVPQAIYQAWRIKELVKDRPHARVLEIGAGVGRTAYYARKFGIEDYAIIDLPMTVLASSYFLARTLGQDQVLLWGEKTEGSQNPVKILPPSEFLDNGDSYDLIINIDSLTEMDPVVARTYWRQIEKRTKMFLSINHEVNPFRVKDLIGESKGVLVVGRAPYWMRKGYVEELVQF